MMHKVVSAKLRSASAMSNWSGAGAGTPKYRYWDLRLDCGHEVERRCRYRPRVGRTPVRGFAAIFSGRSPEDVLPAPKSAKCEVCGRNPSRRRALLPGRTT
jgi:hypothetical protein